MTTPTHPLPPILAGALLLLWPAIYNAYPLVFSDTGGFLEQALMPDMGWDKPWIYGPFLTPLHARLTLWPAIAAQAAILSALLWLTTATLARTSAIRHIALCAALAAASAAPWFASLLMPDILAPTAVLGLYLLANPAALGPWGRGWITAVIAIAIAAHLAHLVLAAAVIAALCLLARRILWRPALPLAAALALLLATNFAGHGKPSISPYGAVFYLARLVADGPARTTIDEACPAAAWRICAWKGRLPADSDDFLWDGNGPVWADGFGPIRYAPEASAVLQATLRAHPGAALAAALRNTARQLVRADIGDALIPDHLEIAVAARIQTYFPPAEHARFAASHQAQGALPALATRFVPLHRAALILGALATLLLATATWRTTPRVAGFALVVLVALLANAAVTGALSGPHDRYQARIAWLALLPPALWLCARPTRARLPPPPAAAGSSAG